MILCSWDFYIGGYWLHSCFPEHQHVLRYTIKWLGPDSFSIRPTFMSDTFPLINFCTSPDTSPGNRNKLSVNLSSFLSTYTVAHSSILTKVWESTANDRSPSFDLLLGFGFNPYSSSWIDFGCSPYVWFTNPSNCIQHVMCAFFNLLLNIKQTLGACTFYHLLKWALGLL